MTKWLPGSLINRNNLLVLIIILVLNGCSSRSKPAPVVDVQGSLPLSQRIKNSVTGSEYIVKKGETLYSIAWRADVDVRTLATINNISKPSQSKRKSKSFNPSKQKVIKKPIAQKKKQEYGGNVAGQKTSKKAQQQNNTFSQKVRGWR